MCYRPAVPWLRVLVLAMALLHATGLTDAMEVACDESCADGEDCGDEGCAPICPTCQCAPCPTGIPLADGAAVFPARVDPTMATFQVVERVVPNPDPLEILRVPILPRV